MAYSTSGKFHMWPKSWISGRADVLLALEEWQHATAQVWEYSVSHSQLLVRIYREEDLATGNLFLYFKGCEQVSFGSIWRDVRFDIQESRGPIEHEFVVSDGDRFRVLARAIFAAKLSDYGLKLSHQFET